MKKKIYNFIFSIFILIFFWSNINALNVTLPYVQYTLSLDLYRASRYNSSIKEFNNLINENPEQMGYIGKANYWLGLNYFALKKFKTADSYFRKVINYHPNCDFYKHAIYYHGQSQYMQKHYNTAMKIFTGFYNKYPWHELADNSMFWKGVSYYKLKNNKTALKYFYRVIKKYPTGNKADASRYMINLILGVGKKVIVKKIDSAELDALAELLKTKEEALIEKEKEISTKEKVLTEKEKIIMDAQEKFKITETQETQQTQ